MASEILSYTDFRRGINDTASPDNMDDNELSVSINADLSTRGGFSKRKGTVKFNQDSFGHECTHVVPWNYKEEERMLAVINKKLHRVNEDGTVTHLQDVAADEIGHFAIKDKIYVCDGVNMWVIDGDLLEPVTATDGETLAKHRLVIDYHVQDAGDIKVTAGGVEKTITVAADETRTEIAVKIKNQTFAGWNVEQEGYELTFEATEPGDKKLFYDPGTTGAWGSIHTEERGVTADNIFDDFKKCTFFTFHVNSMRIFGSGNSEDPTAVYYTEPGDPTFVKSTSVMYPASAEGKVTGMLQFMQSVLVSYNNSWWQFAGDDPEGEYGAPNATWTKLPIPYGSVSPHGVVLTPQSFTFLSKNGLHSVSTHLLGQNFIAVDSTEMVRNLTGEKVEGIMSGLKNRDRARLTYFNNRLYLAYTDNEAVARNNKILIYDWRTRGFTLYDGIEAIDFIRYKEDLMIATNNYILKLGHGGTDVNNVTGEETPYSMIVETKNYNLGSDVNTKFLRLFHIMFRQYEHEDSSVSIKVYSDYSTEEFLDFSLMDSLVYNRPWGLKWGWVDQAQRQVEIMRKAHRFRIRIEASGEDDPVTIYGFGFHYKRLRSRSGRVMKRGLLD